MQLKYYNLLIPVLFSSLTAVNISAEPFWNNVVQNPTTGVIIGTIPLYKKGGVCRSPIVCPIRICYDSINLYVESDILNQSIHLEIYDLEQTNVLIVSESFISEDRPFSLPLSVIGQGAFSLSVSIGEDTYVGQWDND